MPPRRKPRQYNVDGEQFTMAEVVARTGLPLTTIRGRLDRGMRTWAGLEESSAVALRRSQRQLAQRMHGENELRQEQKRGLPARRQQHESMLQRNKNGTVRRV